MTPAPAFLAYLRGAGFALAVRGERLTVSPRGKLTEAECEQVRSLKPELLNLLAAERLTPCLRCKAEFDPDAGADVRTACPRLDCRQGG